MQRELLIKCDVAAILIGYGYHPRAAQDIAIMLMDLINKN
jgi:hypothetical protein